MYKGTAPLELIDPPLPARADVAVGELVSVSPMDLAFTDVLLDEKTDTDYWEEIADEMVIGPFPEKEFPARWGAVVISVPSVKSGTRF